MTDDTAPAVRFPPPLLFIGLVAIGALIDRLAPWPALQVPWPVGAVLTAIGAAVIVAAMQRFRATGENAVPWTGSDAMIANGIYRYTRNPMYLGMAVMQAGLALLLGSITALVLVPVSIAIIQTQVIAREEAYLTGRFGASYQDYCRRVRRWL